MANCGSFLGLTLEKGDGGGRWSGYYDNGRRTERSSSVSSGGGGGGIELFADRRGGSSVMKKRTDVPYTPGRPVFGFSNGRKSVPSKWDDAEKWIISGESPSCAVKSLAKFSKAQKVMDVFKHQLEVVDDKCRVTEEKVSRVSSSSADAIATHQGCSLDGGVSMITKHREVGTEMTPLGSSTTSRCQTPVKSPSPARHNTPADRSGPLAVGIFAGTSSIINMEQLRECHLAKLQLTAQFDPPPSGWNSKEEEEEEATRGLRYAEASNGCQRNDFDSKAARWEEEEKSKCCLRYQREEARVQAWIELQTAKAEAHAKKLELKIQKMRSNLEEKLMKRMANVQRKAEEWRDLARRRHADQVRRVDEQAQKMAQKRSNTQWCRTNPSGCVPGNNTHMVAKIKEF